MNTIAIRELTLQAKEGPADSFGEVFLAEHFGCARRFWGFATIQVLPAGPLLSPPVESLTGQYSPQESR